MILIKWGVFVNTYEERIKIIEQLKKEPLDRLLKINFLLDLIIGVPQSPEACQIQLEEDQAI